ncbi:MAG: NADH-quinone oxidoreductase subunit C [Proteobacteria bacterium]|nr:NADH-quinone oxidoreductase subunit C [Pseudomonadota bacterium]
MSLTQELISTLTAMQVEAGETDYSKCGYHIGVHLKDDQVRNFAQAMLEKGFYLDFVTAIHVTPQFQIVYQFAKFEEACRVNAKALALDDGSIPTISDIYHGADWHERETHDFYGVSFTGHQDLRTLLLCDEDSDLKPLLKKEEKLLSIEGITRKAVENKDTKAEKTEKTNHSPEQE